jgi:tripartite ATP-independent transporter DctM subunit
MEIQDKGHAEARVSTPGGRAYQIGDQLLGYFRRAVELLGAIILVIDLLVVAVAVVARYFFHSPIQGSDEVAQMLLVALTFIGGAAALARGEHMGVVALLSRLPVRWQQILRAASSWVVGCVAVALCWSALSILPLSLGQKTSSGLSESLFFYPVIGGGLAMVIFALGSLLKAPWRATLLSGGILAAFALLWFLCWYFVPDWLPSPMILLLISFVFCLLSGIPVAFALGFAALVFLWTDGTFPIDIYSQQIESGINNFVLLAVPFFILTGLVMDVNGMSTRLIGLLQLLIGKIRGGLHVVMIVSMAVFSGISGSKMADVAAVGSLLIPAIREDGQDPDDAVALLAATAVMGETIPPCINIIILGSVANLSIGGLFAAGIIPAVIMASALVLMAVITGTRRIKTTKAEQPLLPDLATSEQLHQSTQAEEHPPVVRRSHIATLPLIIGAFIALTMIFIIFGGILSGIATPTEVSAFAVIYAIIVGGVAFRQLTVRSVVKLFVDAVSLSGMVLFIVAVAQMVAYILTTQQIPQQLASFMVGLSGSYGTWAFLLVSIVILIAMGSVLEGAPALIIFGPLLIPVAEQLGIHPLHFGVILIIAMGLGLFSPPLGVGIYTSCAVGGVSIERVSRPVFKYLAIIFVTLLLLTFVPWLTLILPQIWHVGG